MVIMTVHFSCQRPLQRSFPIIVKFLQSQHAFGMRFAASHLAKICLMGLKNVDDY